MIKTDFKKNIVISILFVFCIYFLWKLGILYSYSFNPVVSDNRLHVFVDWAAMIKLNICHNKFGINVFYSNPCVPGILDYGNIFLFLPYFESLEKFYFFYFPILIGIIFIFSVVSLIQPKNIFNYFLLILILFSPPTLLVIERANVDMLIFLLIILIAFSNSSFLNFIIITFASLLKYYPLVLMVNFFIEKARSIKKILLILSLFTIVVLSLFYLTGESWGLIQHKIQTFDPPWGNQFSVQAFAIISKKLINYEHPMILPLSYIFFIFFTIIFFLVFKKTKLINKVNIYSFEEKLFILSANLVVTLYLISHNIHYREIFIILLFPFLMKLNESIDNKIFKYLLYFITFRYIFFLISNYYVFFNKSYYLLYFKASSDIILVSSFASICIIMNIEILKQFTKNDPAFRKKMYTM